MSLSIDEIKALPRPKLREMARSVLERIKDHEVIKDAFEEYDVDLEEIDQIPIGFDDLDVSARTDHGVVWLNYALLKDHDLEDDDHYLVHEVIHYLQQCASDEPTQSAEVGNYLDNESELEGFQNQVEYLSETRGNEFAEKYVDQVLDHHDVDSKKEREKRIKELMEFVD